MRPFVVVARDLVRHRHVRRRLELRARRRALRPSPARAACLARASACAPISAAFACSSSAPSRSALRRALSSRFQVANARLRGVDRGLELLAAARRRARELFFGRWIDHAEALRCPRAARHRSTSCSWSCSRSRFVGGPADAITYLSDCSTSCYEKRDVCRNPAKNRRTQRPREPGPAAEAPHPVRARRPNRTSGCSPPRCA